MNFNIPATEKANRFAGFTLIEMLVASSLVVLMMAIFAEVFQIASGSMTLQRSLAENDQQVRTFVTIVRSDLQKRTTRVVIPFYPKESHLDRGVSFDSRQGYFYISTNDPMRGDDSVLQFTVDSGITTELQDETPYYGKATYLGPGTTAQQKAAYLRNNPNQPENDDGQIQPNGAASSQKAQIAYFKRGGNLYRRVILIREALAVAGNGNGSGNNTSTINPKDDSGVELLRPSLNLVTSSYWNAFDLSAWRAPYSGTNANVQIIGVDSTRNDLDNRLATAISPLGRSRYRFGFDQATGQSREFFGASNELFLGRFTHQETSDVDFAFPYQLYGGTSNPFASTTTLLDANADGVVDPFAEGSRVGEDLLLTNVHGFEIEVFDDRRNEFVALGYSTGTVGDFHISRCLNSTYVPPGSSTSFGHCFDTWHPYYDRDGGDDANLNSNTRTQDDPPYRPMTFDPTGVSAPVPTNPGSRPAIWTTGVDYEVGDIVFPPTEDINYNGILDPGEDGTFGFAADGAINAPTAKIRVPTQQTGRVYYYRCRKRATTNGMGAPVLSASYDDQPAWSTSAGQVFGHDQTPLPNVRDQMAFWEPVLNLRPVRSIRITVRFLHQSSNKMRQITLMHALRDESP